MTDYNLLNKLTAVFRDILPGYGYTVRENQITLARHMLGTMQNGGIALCEAGVGTGKTHAYIIAAVFQMTNNPHFTKIRQSYPCDSGYYRTTKMPIVISTSTIELQRAITQEYIPEISRILMEHNIISEPLTCVVRKGKRHYICDRRLDDYLMSSDTEQQPLLKCLIAADFRSIDLDAHDLTRYVKSRINVPVWCNSLCPRRDHCRYTLLQAYQKLNTHHFQVCNHNLFFADLKKRRNGQNPLLPNYQGVIFDEAHKLPDAARQLYGITVSDIEVQRLSDLFLRLNFRNNKTAETVKSLCEDAQKYSMGLFSGLCPGQGDESNRVPVDMNGIRRIYAQNLIHRLEELRDIVRDGGLISHAQDRTLIHAKRLTDGLIERMNSLITSNAYILWAEQCLTDGCEVVLNAVPKQLDMEVYRDLWSKPIPAVLTSGTLSAAGSFEHYKQTMGINIPIIDRTAEIVQQSPFDYKNNCMIYIACDLPFPNPKDGKYIEAVSDRITALAQATHGHTLALFTSYRVMELVYLKLENTVPFPLMKATRGILGTLDHFEQSGNGILFAAGSCWEGVNIPGDALSSLIVVKLPFPVPSPLLEYERTRYDSGAAFAEQVLIPEMIIKLKQGAGRLIRNEADTGVISILDSRMKSEGRYRDTVLRALPSCPVTEELSDVAQFIRQKKNDKYFK